MAYTAEPPDTKSKAPPMDTPMTAPAAGPPCQEAHSTASTARQPPSEIWESRYTGASDINRVASSTTSPARRAGEISLSSRRVRMGISTPR